MRQENALCAVVVAVAGTGRTDWRLMGKRLVEQAARMRISLRMVAKAVVHLATLNLLRIFNERKKKKLSQKRDKMTWT